VVAGNVVEITEEKAAKVCIKAFTCADTGRTDKAEAREHKQPSGQCIVAMLSFLHMLLFPQGSSSISFGCCGSISPARLKLSSINALLTSPAKALTQASHIAIAVFAKQ
jgi:hypothetical protein